MNYKKLNYIFLLLLVTSLACVGQELNIEVRILSPNNNKVDKALFEELRKDMENFFNQTKWTDDIYQDHEKIQGNVTLVVTNEESSNQFSGDLSVQSTRPVYKSSYKTPIMNYTDQGVPVTFNPGQLIQKSDVSYFDNLSSILTFYAYMMIGMDYDSFSPYGGDKYFEICRNIINALPLSLVTSPGWDNRGGVVGRNRYWMVENLMSPRLRPYRQFYYEYHRIGLDELHKDVDRQRAVLASSLNSMQEVISVYPNTMSLQMFSDAKREEIVEIFKPADRGQKKKIYDIMIQFDPARAEKYLDLTK